MLRMRTPTRPSSQTCSIATAISMLCCSRGGCLEAKKHACCECAGLIARTNYLGAVSVSVPIVERLKAQGHGTIVVLSSVAGERVHAANFTYGSSKAGLDGYFQGLADSLVGSGVHIMIVRPGFVVSKMTEGMEAAPLSTTPEAVRPRLRKELAGFGNGLGARCPALRHVGVAPCPSRHFPPPPGVIHA